MGLNAVGYIMYKDNSIDQSFYLDQANSQCKFKQAQAEAPYSDLVKDDSVTGFILPYLWFNRTDLTYYISCQKKREQDIHIGILIPNAKRIESGGGKMFKQKEGYLFDSDDKYFHFLSLNWLDAENEQGSKTYKENICFGDYSEDFLDSLYGYLTDNSPSNRHDSLYWFYNIDNSNGVALENNNLCIYDYCIDNYLMDSYAGYCYRYYTYGTKQGDWHMIDLNTFYMFLDDSNGPSLSFISILQRTREAVGDGGFYNCYKAPLLTAFTWLDGHRFIHEHNLKQTGILGSDYIGNGNYFVDKTQRCGALAQLKLPVSMFKFK